jgi:hypothetical protein
LNPSISSICMRPITISPYKRIDLFIYFGRWECSFTRKRIFKFRINKNFKEDLFLLEGLKKIIFGIGFAHMEVKGECVNLSSGDFSAKS